MLDAERLDREEDCLHSKLAESRAVYIHLKIFVTTGFFGWWMWKRKRGGTLGEQENEIYKREAHL